jgi:putative transposase
MADTCYSINIHYVFSTQDRAPLITGELRDRLSQFVGGTLRKHGTKPLCIGGTSDHVHILVSLPTTMSVGRAVQLAKGSSLKWIHETFADKRTFSWQEGYAAFSVSVSQIPTTVTYIRNQAKHHLRQTFEEEYVAFLKKHEINFDRRYLWR